MTCLRSLSLGGKWLRYNCLFNSSNVKCDSAITIEPISLIRTEWRSDKFCKNEKTLKIVHVACTLVITLRFKTIQNSKTLLSLITYSSLKQFGQAPDKLIPANITTARSTDDIFMVWKKENAIYWNIVKTEKNLRAKRLLTAEKHDCEISRIKYSQQSFRQPETKKSSDILFSVKWWVIDGIWDKIV